MRLAAVDSAAATFAWSKAAAFVPVAASTRKNSMPFSVVVRAPGYEEVSRRGVREGETVVVTLGRKGALLVSVVGEDGAPVVGARVLVASPSLWPS